MAKHYNLKDLEEFVGKVVTFDVRVDNSKVGEEVQSPVFLIKEVKKCINGNEIIVGFNFMRINNEHREPYRAYSVSAIVFGSIKIM